MYFEIDSVIPIKDLDISIRCLFSHINTKREITTHNTQHSHAYLTLFQRVAPAGVKWTGHSLCLGGASVARAVGVDLYIIMAQCSKICTLICCRTQQPTFPLALDGSASACDSHLQFCTAYFMCWTLL